MTMMMAIGSFIVGPHSAVGHDGDCIDRLKHLFLSGTSCTAMLFLFCVICVAGERYACAGREPV